MKNSDFPKHIDDVFFTEEIVDPFATTNDADASENSEKLIAKMKITLNETNSENSSTKRFKTATENNIKMFGSTGKQIYENITPNRVLKSYKVCNSFFFKSINAMIPLSLILLKFMFGVY